MEEKTRKILGWAVLSYSAILLLLFVLTIAIPAIAKIAHRTWIDHLRSLWLIYLSFELGRSLLRGKISGATFVRLMGCVFLLLPLLTLEQALKMEATEGGNWLFWRSVLLILSSACFLILPYLLQDQFLKWLGSRKSPSGVSPAQGLCLIGVICSVIPSSCLTFFTIERQMVYFLVGISYVACIVWWVWWNNHYSS